MVCTRRCMSQDGTNQSRPAACVPLCVAQSRARPHCAKSLVLVRECPPDYAAHGGWGRCSEFLGYRTEAKELEGRGLDSFGLRFDHFVSITFDIPVPGRGAEYLFLHPSSRVSHAWLFVMSTFESGDVRSQARGAGGDVERLDGVRRLVWAAVRDQYAT